MPNYSKGKYYTQHDNRGRYQQAPAVPTIRKVSFKNNQPRKSNRGKLFGSTSRLFENQMRDFYNNEFEEIAPSNYNRGGGGGPGPSRPPPLQFMESNCGWYKVQVLKSARYEKTYLINLIRDYVKPYEFEYYNFIKVNDTYSFFVANFDLAEKLFLSRGRIKTATNSTLLLMVKSSTPYIELNETLREKIKLVMAKRYNAQTNALDLSNFHNDPDFLSNNYFVPLDRSNIMTCVCKIIDDNNLQDLYALNLSDNKIYYRESMIGIAKAMPRLKILYLSNNKIRDISVLRCLEGLSNLEELKLEKNPFSTKFTDESSYTYEVKKIFPKLLKLDDIMLPPPIVFDVEENISLPKPQGSFLCCAEAGPVARTFLEQYFALFDTEKREGLIDAYHEKAEYSMSAVSGFGNNAFLEYQIRQARNLLRLDEPGRQKVLLSVGKTEIVRSIQMLPPTKHDLSSFTCDCPVFSPGLIQLTVCGLFEEIHETSHKKKIIRYFNRVFLLVPNGYGGFAITNDQLYITSATPEQYIQAVKKVETNAPSSSQASTSSADDTLSNEIIIKQNMVRALSQNTGMNLQFSEHCLNEVQWNYDKALDTFNQLKASNSIPAEAFVS